MTHEKSSAESAPDESTVFPQGHRSKPDRARSEVMNVSPTERLLSGVMGGALLFRSAMRPFSGPGALSAVLGVAFLYRSLGGIASSESIRGRGVQPQVMRQTIGEVCESLNPGWQAIEHRMTRSTPPPYLTLPTCLLSSPS